MTDTTATGEFHEIARVSGVLLDMDGTLVNSEKSVVESWNTLFAEMGLDEKFDDRFHGQPARNVLKLAVPGISEEEIPALHARAEGYELETADTVEAIGGTARVLAELEAASRDLGRQAWTISTSCTMRLFKARYEQLGLPMPLNPVTADQVTHGKPDPEPYLEAAARLGVRADDCLVVEDAPGGLRAARASGAYTVSVLTTSAKASVDALADLTVESIDDLAFKAQDGVIVVSARSHAGR